ncbi:MAG: AtzE family amidohydrolase [Alphaproteobacteria bacterium]|nr:AtzE family amidohydrolase [Alphaproteobacteria bacterium]
MTAATLPASAGEIASAVRSRRLSACEAMQFALDRIERSNKLINAFTYVLQQRALEQAAALDARIARGEDPGPLAGVPFAVKNLFDIKGVVTLAGSRINASNPGATRDAFVIRQLEAAGAILAGALNMGEYAYDFTGENAHYGSSRNPLDITRMSGGSSGGSGAAVSAGMTPVALGSDTNGSIRVPAAFCGIFGLKPTYGRLSRAGTFPFVSSLDHVGPLARSTADLALAYDAMLGLDAEDPVLSRQPPAPVFPTLSLGGEGLRIRVASGYFRQGANTAALRAVDQIAHALSAQEEIEITNAGIARAAAFLITMAEGAALHAERLRTRFDDFDPDTVHRLAAGALLPANWIVKAHKFRRHYQKEMKRIFETCDIILAPATPCPATRIGQKYFELDGVQMPVRANIGVFTQPVSFAGLPVVTVPVKVPGEQMPLGVQIIAAPWREDLALRVASHLEACGAANAFTAPALMDGGPVDGN